MTRARRVRVWVLKWSATERQDEPENVLKYDPRQRDRDDDHDAPDQT
jgi:hypothetical protein